MEERASNRTGPIDVFIGERLKHERLKKGLTQGDLASSLGVSHQQMQKYEQGKNRISAARLHQIAQFLEVDIRSFFEGIDSVKKSNRSEFFALDDESMRVAIAWRKIKSKKTRSHIKLLIKGLSSNQAN